MKYTPHILLISLLLGVAPPAAEAQDAAPAAAPFAQAGPIRIGSKSFTESVLLGELLCRMIESAGQPVQHRPELGGTQVLWQALLAGEIDAYPEYTGTIRQEILAGQTALDDDALSELLAKKGVIVAGKLGFSNTYALGMREDVAEKYGINKISDLAKHPDLRMGLSDEFLERKDGWPGLAAKYQLQQTMVRGIDHNLAYRGLVHGQIDIMDVFSTDADIRLYNIRVLEDDRGYFPPYAAVMLVRADVAQRSPQSLSALRQLAGRIDDDTMRGLNARVQVDRISERNAAGEFARDKLGLNVKLEPNDASAIWQRRLSRLGQTTLEHLLLVGVSLTAAVLAGIPLGIVCYRRPRLGQGVLAVVGVIQTLPSMALLVFMIPFLGLGAGPAVVALFLYSLLPIVRGTHSGLTQVSAAIRESAEVLGLPSFARLRLVELPIASRSILAGIKTAAVINVGTATIGALVGAGGYGQPILTGIRLNDLPLILSGAIPAALMAVVAQFMFGWIEHKVSPAA